MVDASIICSEQDMIDAQCEPRQNEKASGHYALVFGVKDVYEYKWIHVRFEQEVTRIRYHVVHLQREGSPRKRESDLDAIVRPLGSRSMALRDRKASMTDGKTKQNLQQGFPDVPCTLWYMSSHKV
jgi:hypothetical protein